MHAPTHLLLLARAEARLGRLVEAEEAYLKLRNEELPDGAPRPFMRAKEAAQHELDALEPRLPKLTVLVNGADAKEVSLTIDGAPASAAFLGFAMPIDPGSHTIAGTTHAGSSAPVTVSIGEGSTLSVTLRFTESGASIAPTAPAAPQPLLRASTPERIAEPPPPQEPGGLPVAAWTSIGVGAAGAIAAGVFVLLNRIDRTDADNDCGSSGCPLSKQAQIQSLDGQADTAATLAWVGLGVAAAGVGTGVALLVVHRARTSPDVATLLHPWLGPNVAGLGVSGAF
jgi:hypothetical protein